MAVYTSPKRKRDAPETITRVQTPPPTSTSNNDDQSDIRGSHSSLHLQLDVAAESSGAGGRAPQQQQPAADGSPGGKVTTQFEGLRLMGDGVGKLHWGAMGSGGDHTAGDESVRKKRPKQTQDSSDGHDKVDFADIDLTGAREPTTSTSANGTSHASQSPASTASAIKFNDETSAPPGQPSETPQMSPASALPRAGRKSPPLQTADRTSSGLTWQEHEITGHIADDPDDDGEGVNGIGFRPTAAMAYARAERRRQQIAEYKSREAREARRARSERRTKEKGVERALEMGKEKRRVRFGGEEGRKG